MSIPRSSPGDWDNTDAVRSDFVQLGKLVGGHRTSVGGHVAPTSSMNHRFEEKRTAAQSAALLDGRMPRRGAVHLLAPKSHAMCQRSKNRLAEESLATKEFGAQFSMTEIDRTFWICLTGLHAASVEGRCQNAPSMDATN